MLSVNDMKDSRASDPDNAITAEDEMPEGETVDTSVTITEGTIYLIAEVLRAERGATMLDMDDAVEALKNAMRELSS